MKIPTEARHREELQAALPGGHQRHLSRRRDDSPAGRRLGSTSPKLQSDY